MSAAPLYPEPSWLHTIPEEERGSARLRWVLEIAAAYATAEGTMTALSVLCGMDQSTIGKAKHLGQLSPRLAIKIENVLGRDIMPREMLCPEFFVVEG
ncbi:hypothetical protein [Sphingomonas phage Carli]|nr:hypothetical protein [Sphingomonas phage Carli]